jgi:hypothetical protein
VQLDWECILCPTPRQFIDKVCGVETAHNPLLSVSKLLIIFCCVIIPFVALVWSLIFRTKVKHWFFPAVRRQNCIEELPLVAEVVPTLRAAMFALNLHSDAATSERQQC